MRRTLVTTALATAGLAAAPAAATAAAPVGTGSGIGPGSTSGGAAFLQTDFARATVFGGGAIGKKIRLPDHEDVSFARLEAKGSSVTVTTLVAAQCGALGLSGEVAGAENVKLSRTGAFSVSGPIDVTGPGGTAKGTFSIKGRVSEAGGATATASTQYTFTPVAGSPAATTPAGPGPFECRSGDQELELRSAAAPAGPATPEKGGAYYGLTSEERPFMFRLTRDGKGMEQAAMTASARCTRGMEIDATDISPSTKIAKDGSFRREEDYDFPTFSLEQPNDAMVKYHADLEGKLSRGRVTGTWRITAQIVRKADNAVVDTCDTGTLKVKGTPKTGRVKVIGTP